MTQERIADHPTLGSLGEADSGPSVVPSAATRLAKPSVALFVDTETWAFASIARQVMRHLSEYYTFRMVPVSVIENVDQLLMITEGADLRHFLWREIPRQIGTPYYRSYVERLGWSYEDFEARFLGERRLTTWVCDHLMLDDDDLAERAPFFNSSLLHGYGTSSRRLFDIYAALPEYPPPSAVLEGGVDRELFTPMGVGRRAADGDDELVVGWVGNSRWNSDIEDFKGVHTIVRPALELLRSSGLAVREHFADASETLIPFAAMPQYYSEIDVLVCASKHEGTPQPLLEAMACGVPIVTTDVGVVPEVFGPCQREFILAERTVQDLADRLADLARHRSVLTELSRENLDHIRAWGWDRKALAYRAFFDEVLAR